MTAEMQHDNAGQPLCNDKGAGRNMWLCIGIVVAVLVVDQIIKVLIKTGLPLHESIHIADWFYLLHVENNGMAFGMEFVPKWLLTSFRIVAVAAIAYYIWLCLKLGESKGYLTCLSLIVAGAAGNIIDCLFYGLIWNEGTLLNGRVVDMFYFPLMEWDWPQWMPLWAGEHFIFFSPVFNFADAAISCGVVALLLFYHKKLNA